MLNIMDNITRIINTVQGKQIDRLPFFIHWGLNPWIPTRRNWETQGVSDGECWREVLEEQTGIKLDKGFMTVGVDNGRKEGVNLGYCPFFEEEVIEDKGDRHIIKDTICSITEAWCNYYEWNKRRKTLSCKKTWSNPHNKYKKRRSIQ